MNKDERAGLAQQLLSNPLFDEIMNDLETSAINRCVNAKMTDNDLRSAAAAEVRAIRAFRSNCQAMLDNKRPTKGAPA